MHYPQLSGARQRKLIYRAPTRALDTPGTQRAGKLHHNSGGVKRHAGRQLYKPRQTPVTPLQGNPPLGGAGLARW